MKTVLALAALLLLLGCDPLASRKRPVEQRLVERFDPNEHRAAQQPAAARPSLVDFSGVWYAPVSDTVTGVLGHAAPATNMVIRSGTASIKVDSLEPAVTLVRQLAARVGGYVANTTLQTGEGQLRSATLEIKVPAARFDEALAGLAPIGRVEAVNVSTEDVGEEYVDVTARTENARRLERRLIDILGNRTGRLKDVLDVERELARAREEIDRNEGRLRYLRAHVTLSTLSVSVHEPAPVVGEAGTSVMGEAFKQAWRNLVWLTAFLVQSLGVVLPLGVLAGAGWFVQQQILRFARVPRARSG